MIARVDVGVEALDPVGHELHRAAQHFGEPEVSSYLSDFGWTSKITEDICE
jgi:hypothetical protein